MRKPCLLDALRLQKSMKNRSLQACRMEAPKKTKKHENTSPRTSLEDPQGSRLMSKIQKKLDPGHLEIHMASPNLSRTPPGSPGTPLDPLRASFFHTFPYLVMCKTKCKTALFFLKNCVKKKCVSSPQGVIGILRSIDFIFLLRQGWQPTTKQQYIYIYV